MPDCPYCDTESQSEGELTGHLDDSHSREELSRVDRKRVEKHAAESGARSRLGRVVPDGRLSRRATLVAAGTALAGIGVGIGRRMASSHTQIQDWNDLDNVRNGLSDDYVLANDLDQNTAGYNSVASPSANGGNGFEPIGDTDGDKFTGSFDGAGNEIRNLVIDRTDQQDVGLFGAADAATIQNLDVVDASVKGGQDTGILVGEIIDDAGPGEITDVHVTGNVEGVGGTDGGDGGAVGGIAGRTRVDIVRSSAIVDVTGVSVILDSSESEASGTEVGGIAGVISTGQVRKSWVAGTVLGTGEGGFPPGFVAGGGGVAGGIIGEAGSSEIISNSYSLADVTTDGVDDEQGSDKTGGLLGDTFIEGVTLIEESYAVGDVSGELGDVGGLAGDVGDNDIRRSYWDTQATGQSQANGTGGADAEGLTTSEMQGATAESSMSDLDFGSTWRTVETSDALATADGYPILESAGSLTQIERQGVLDPPTGVKINADNTTFDNVTVANDN